MHPDAERSDKKRILCVLPATEVADRLQGLLPETRLYAPRTGGAALEFARDSVFDLYVIGERLEDMPGLELCRRLRQFDPTTPILMCFHEGDETRRGPLDSALAHGYIGNPVDPFVAPHVIRSALAEARACSVAARAAEWRAVQEQLVERMEAAAGRLARAREAYLIAHETALMACAYDAFAAAGGMRADFRRMWPALCRDACAGTPPA